jgi:hypothetical protein
MFEPLIVGIFLPYLPVAPWICRHTNQVLALASRLSGVRLSPQEDEQSVLQQLWDVPRGVSFRFAGDYGAGLVTSRTNLSGFLFGHL